MSLSSSNPRSRTGIGVLECSAGRYRMTHLIPLESQPSGMTLTHDGKLLLVADGDFVAFVDVRRAIARQDAIVGYFQDIDGDDSGAVYVNVSPDDRLAFVSDENVAAISVIDLARARAGGFKRAAIVGTIPTGRAPIALTFTTDGRYLLTTSQRALPAENFPPRANRRAKTPRPQRRRTHPARSSSSTSPKPRPTPRTRWFRAFRPAAARCASRSRRTERQPG